MNRAKLKPKRKREEIIKSQKSKKKKKRKSCKKKKKEKKENTKKFNLAAFLDPFNPDPQKPVKSRGLYNALKSLQNSNIEKELTTIVKQ